MNTFNMTAIKGQDFFYKRGSIYTTKIWKRPSFNSLKLFLQKIESDTSILSDYEVYVMGGVLYSFDETWDIDFCLVGDIPSYHKLEGQMNQMYDLALNHFQILIDVQWLEIPLPEITYQEVSSSEFLGYRLKFIKTTPIIKKVGDSQSVWDLREREGIIKHTETLVEGYHESYPGTKPKIINRILSHTDKVLKSVMSVWDILNNDEEYFNKNTNRF